MFLFAAAGVFFFLFFSDCCRMGERGEFVQVKKTTQNEKMWKLFRVICFLLDRCCCLYSLLIGWLIFFLFNFVSLNSLML